MDVNESDRDRKGDDEVVALSFDIDVPALRFAVNHPEGWRLVSSRSLIDSAEIAWR